MARSTDGGQSWAETTVDEPTPTERFLVFLPPVPSVAVDGERVYVAFHDGRTGGEPEDDADVWLWASPDGGEGWEAPVRVNDTPTGDGTRQHLPQVDVAATGRVDVVYYDRRDDPDNVFNEVSLQASMDGGAAFTDRVVLSDTAFDSRVGFGAVPGHARPRQLPRACLHPRAGAGGVGRHPGGQRGVGQAGPVPGGRGVRRRARLVAPRPDRAAPGRRRPRRGRCRPARRVGGRPAWPHGDHRLRHR